MSQKMDRQEMSYSCLIDNFKVILIFLVVFNHIIAFQLVKIDKMVKYIWYAIYIFHMPAFIFVSGYLSKKTQNVLKNVKNLLLPYVLGYSLTWWIQVWAGNKMDYELLRPSGTVMWYVLALFVYRLTIEAFGKIRFVVPLSIIFALWAGTRMEFSTFLSSSRIVVFFPFFVAGYLWKSEYIEMLRKLKGKWNILVLAVFLLLAITNYMISRELPVDIFRGNHSYKACDLDDLQGIIIRLLTYFASFLVILASLALLPDRKLPLTFIGSGGKTMGIYFLHYPIMIVMNELLILKIPELLNIWVLFGLSLLFICVLGSLPVNWVYNSILRTITSILFKSKSNNVV